MTDHRPFQKHAIGILISVLGSFGSFGALSGCSASNAPGPVSSSESAAGSSASTTAISPSGSGSTSAASAGPSGGSSTGAVSADASSQSLGTSGSTASSASSSTGASTSGSSSSPSGMPPTSQSGGIPPRPYVNNGAACGATASWANPGNQGIADPSMTKQGTKYYAYGTGGGYSTTTNFVTYARGGSIFPNGLPSWTTQYIASPALWAPDVHLVGNTYYCYYAISAWNNFDSSVGVATSTNLDGPWTDHGDVVDYKTGGSGVNVIDPDLFVDDNGTWWLIYGSYKAGLRLIQLDPSTGKALNGTPNPTVITTSLGEGSDIIQHNGYYYVFASRGKCCAGLQSTYQVVMGRSKTVTGPYVGMNGEQWKSNAYTVFLTGDANHPGVGGQSFFRDTNNQLYMVYMAYTAPSGGSILNVRPMWFDANDWPTLDPCKAATY